MLILSHIQQDPDRMKQLPALLKPFHQDPKVQLNEDAARLKKTAQSMKIDDVWQIITEVLADLKTTRGLQRPLEGRVDVKPFMVLSSGISAQESSLGET